MEKELGGLLFYQDRCMFLTSLINEKGGGEVNQFGDACASPFSFQIEIGFCIYTFQSLYLLKENTHIEPNSSTRNT